MDRRAFIKLAGAEPKLVHLNDLLDQPAQLEEFQAMMFIGGFSYAIPVIFGQAPENKEDEPMVFLGDDGTRATTADIYA